MVVVVWSTGSRRPRVSASAANQPPLCSESSTPLPSDPVDSAYHHITFTRKCEGYMMLGVAHRVARLLPFLFHFFQPHIFGMVALAHRTLGRRCGI